MKLSTHSLESSSGWMLRVGTDQELMACSCSDETSYNQRLLVFGRPPLAQRAPNPAACSQHPRAKPQPALLPCAAENQRVWWRPEASWWTSAISWCRLSSQNQPPLSWGKLLEVRLPWQPILYPRGILVCDLMGGLHHFPNNNYFTRKKSFFFAVGFFSRPQNLILHGKQSLEVCEFPYQMEPVPTSCRGQALSLHPQGMLTTAILPPCNCTEVLLEGGGGVTFWG